MAVTIQDVVKAYLVMVGVRLLSKPEEGLQTIGWYDVQIAGAGLIADIPAGITEPGHTFAGSHHA